MVHADDVKLFSEKQRTARDSRLNGRIRTSLCVRCSTPDVQGYHLATQVAAASIIVVRFHVREADNASSCFSTPRRAGDLVTEGRIPDTHALHNKATLRSDAVF